MRGVVCFICAAVIISTAFMTSCGDDNTVTTTPRSIKENMSTQMIPTPKTLTGGERGLMYEATITESAEYAGAVNSFIKYAAKLGASFSTSSDGEIKLNSDSAITEGAYKLDIGDNGVNIYVSDDTGANHAFAALLQLMDIDDNNVYFPECVIEDQADSEYRGMMVDLARNWHDFSYLLSYVDICYYYKIAVLHLHFTDDQSYTLPSELYPDLSTDGRHYTKEQIAELVAYAEERGVELMPEIDVPGHCTSFREAYHRIFGTTGIICQHQESMDAMQALFGELCDMFPNSKYIHIGGDEAAIANWTTCGKCRKYARSIGIDADMADKNLLAEQMYANFVSLMADAVFAKGRTPIVWEGFAKEVNDRVSKDIIVMSWENFYQVTPDLLEAGFKIINCSWNPMYIVTPEPAWPTNEVYAWSIYQWKPVHGDSPYAGLTLTIEPNDNVLGGQLLAWGDRIVGYCPSVEEGVKQERDLLIERAPYMAQNTWNVDKGDAKYEDIKAICDEVNAKLLKIIG